MGPWVKHPTENYLFGNQAILSGSIIKNSVKVPKFFNWVVQADAETNRQQTFYHFNSNTGESFMFLCLCLPSKYFASHFGFLVKKRPNRLETLFQFLQTLRM